MTPDVYICRAAQQLLSVTTLLPWLCPYASSLLANVGKALRNPFLCFPVSC